MVISVVLCHPRPQSLNHAIAQAVTEQMRAHGHQVLFHDLYAEEFPPIISAAEAAGAPPDDALVARHCEEIGRADGIVVVHPNWWGQPPAVLKGWVDRVLRVGVAYDWAQGDEGAGVPIGLLRARAALVFNTANTPPDRETAAFGNPLDLLWRDCVFGLCGVRSYQRTVFSVVATSTPEERAAWISAAASMAGSFFPPENTAS